MPINSLVIAIFKSIIMILLIKTIFVLNIKLSIQYKGLIIGLTGNALEEDLNNMVLAGANHALVKPLDKEVFFGLLHEYFSQQNNNVE